MNSRDKRRIERIKKEVSLGEILSFLGYEIDSNSNREQQFRCDLHGEDNKPSARFYPSTNSTYCWVCHLPRTGLDYILEKRGLNMEDSLSFLEQRYDLPSLGWESLEEKEIIEIPVYSNVGRSKLSCLKSLLTQITRGRMLDMGYTLLCWDIYDNLLLHPEKSRIENQAWDLLMKIENKLRETTI
jgi:hypothetical protein